mgnify:CR=1 FL=1
MKLTEHIHAFLWRSMSANNCNTFLFNGKKRILIDPGHAHLFDHVQSGLSDLGIGLGDIDMVICTHAHPDHLEAARFFVDTPALIAIHEEDWKLVQLMVDRLGGHVGAGFDKLEPSLFLTEGDLTVGDMQFRIFHTPGHSPGGISLYWPEEKALVTGDLIFSNGLGRTDLPGGDGKTLKASIRKVSSIGAELLLPGHGETISGSHEVAANFERVERQWFNYI